MRFTIGKFEGSLPDRPIFYSVLEILSLASDTAGTRFYSPVSKFHKFFYEMKQKHPDIFEDVYFNYDPEFPYSDEIEDCFIRLQESGYATRPNPSLNEFRMDVDLSRKKPNPDRHDFNSLKQMADEFKRNFIISEGSCEC